MLKLEEYIEKRKSEDGINEFDSSQKINNIRMCINYIFEYFDQYLPMQGTEKRTVAENIKLSKYEKSLGEYSQDIKEWLLSVYESYNKQINRLVSSFLSSYDGYYLLHSEADFRSVSYECYAALIKKNPFFKNQTEKLYLFIREYHYRDSACRIKFYPYITNDITNWLNNTYQKYNVCITAEIDRYLSDFFHNEGLWSPGSRIKLEHPYLDHKYDYNYKVKNNLFNINTFYSKYANKPFIKGKKKELEMVMMYIWLHSLAGDKAYWDEYLLTIGE